MCGANTLSLTAKLSHLEDLDRERTAQHMVVLSLEPAPEVEVPDEFDSDDIREFMVYVTGIQKAKAETLDVPHTALEVYDVLLDNYEDMDCPDHATLSFHVEFAGNDPPGRRLDSTFVILDFPSLEAGAEVMEKEGKVTGFSYEHHASPDRAWYTIELPDSSRLRRHG